MISYLDPRPRETTSAEVRRLLGASSILEIEQDVHGSVWVTYVDEDERTARAVARNRVIERWCLRLMELSGSDRMTFG